MGKSSYATTHNHLLFLNASESLGLSTTPVIYPTLTEWNLTVLRVYNRSQSEELDRAAKPRPGPPLSAVRVGFHFVRVPEFQRSYSGATLVSREFQTVAYAELASSGMQHFMSCPGELASPGMQHGSQPM